MPARTRKRKAPEEDDATPEVIPAAKKPPRASRTSHKESQGQSSKSKRSSKKGRPMTSENLNPVRASRSSKSTTSSVSTTKRDIRRKADELVHSIETQVDDRPSNLGSGTAATESKTTPHRKDVIDLEHESISQSHNAIYQELCEHLQSLQETIDKYKKLNDITVSLKNPTEVGQWEQDSTSISNVDKRAMEIATDTLNGIVLGEKRADSHRSPAQSVDDEVEQAARRWLQTGIPIMEDTWGDAAREALNAFSGVAKILS